MRRGNDEGERLEEAQDERSRTSEDVKESSALLESNRIAFEVGEFELVVCAVIGGLEKKKSSSSEKRPFI